MTATIKRVDTVLCASEREKKREEEKRRRKSRRKLDAKIGKLRDDGARR